MNCCGCVLIRICFGLLRSQVQIDEETASIDDTAALCTATDKPIVRSPRSALRGKQLAVTARANICMILEACKPPRHKI
jgi:hypothetical protein